MARFRSYLRKKTEDGFIVSAELVFIVTILVIGLVVGWVALRNAMVAELHDSAEAIGALDQSYNYSGTNGQMGVNASTAGSNFDDAPDSAAVVAPGAIPAGDRLPVTVLAPAGDTEAAP